MYGIDPMKIRIEKEKKLKITSALTYEGVYEE